MMSFKLSISVLSLLGFACGASGSSGINRGPLADATSVVIEEILIGNTLSDPAEHAAPLFGTDFKRTTAFKGLLLKKAQARIQQAGLNNGERTAHSLSLGFFGGQFKAEACGKEVFFMFALRVAAPTDKFSSVERTVLGVTSDVELESALTKAAIETLDEVLGQRERARSAD